MLWANLKHTRYLGMISLFLLATLFASSNASSKKLKCQDEECQMKPEHFKLYSTVKRALEQDFSIKGKDLISLIRSVEVLDRRFKPNDAGKQIETSTLNGTDLVLKLLANQKLRNAMMVFSSDDGRQLINLYKTSINGNHQNLACSKWRVEEIEFVAKKLDQDEKLAKVFANIHKNFVERSARKCLKSSCSSLDENMSRLDSVVRRSSRRKGFLAHDDTLTFELTATKTTPANGSSGLPEESNGGGNSVDDALIAQLENEPISEFQAEELELCRFFKRTNDTNCQASGNELSELSFVKSIKHTNETTNTNQQQSSTGDLSSYLADYQANSHKHAKLIDQTKASDLILAQCGAIRPVLDYHMFGLRWYQRQGLISTEKLRARTFWCPSLTYWFETDRLCNELKLALRADGSQNNESFAY